MERIQIGTVLKPQGISGQIKISDLTDGKDAVKNLTTVFIGECEYKVLAKTVGAGYVFLTLKGIADRNAAELLRGKEVYCNKSELIVSEGRLFIADVIGCDLYLSSGKKLGKIVDVTSGNTDLFKVETLEGFCYFPFLKKLNAVVNLAEKTITVDAKIFTEVCLYQS